MMNINNQLPAVAGCAKSRTWLNVRGIFTVAFIGLIATSSAGAASYQAQEPLRQLTKEYLEQRFTERGNNDVEITVGRLDSRLRLTPCQETPSAFMPPGSKLSGKLTVGLRCASPKPWTLYIPAEIKIFADVIAAALPLKRDSQITRNDIASLRLEVSSLHAGYFTDAKHVIGKILKSSINEGDAFSPRRLKAPLMVRQGEEVTIIASVGNLQVRSKGKALRNAAKGERVSVRNLRSKRVIEAVAIKPGIVRINM